MAGIEDLSPADSAALLEELVEFATQERFVYSHTWRKDDVVMWDNRCTMHAVTPFDNARSAASCIARRWPARPRCSPPDLGMDTRRAALAPMRALHARGASARAMGRRRSPIGRGPVEASSSLEQSKHSVFAFPPPTGI